MKEPFGSLIAEKFFDCGKLTLLTAEETIFKARANA